MRFQYVSLKKQSKRPVIHICRTDTQTWCKIEKGTRKPLQGLHQIPAGGRLCKNCETVRDQVATIIDESLSRKLDKEFRAIMG